MNRRILIPTDFSRNALNAVRYALDLYQGDTCDFYLFNVYQRQFSTANMSVPETGEPGYETSQDHSQEQLQKLLQQVRLHEDNPKHQFHTIQQFNSLVEGIRDVVAAKDIDLIVMGTKGATGSETLIFGTNAVNVMEEVRDVPVLAVPSGYAFVPPREIVFPTDFKSSFKRKELYPLMNIAKTHGSVIRVLHIRKEPALSSKQQANKALLEEILATVDHEFHELSDIKLHEGIGAFIESRGSDMIVFMNRKHKLFGSILSQPLVKKIGYSYDIPMLALHEPSK